MFHVHTSEFSAAITLLLCLIAPVAAAVVVPEWWTARNWLDICIYVLGSGVACRWVAAGHSCQWPSGVDFKGSVALVTGGSSGVGYAVAEELAVHGWTVLLGGPNRERLLLARRRIMKKVVRAKSAGSVLVVGVFDLSDAGSVRKFALDVSEVHAKRHSISLLVNAAGTLRRHRKLCSCDAWPQLEVMLATNAVGPMLLTQLMLPLLEETADRTKITSRIINVSSSCHTFLGPGRPSHYDPLELIARLDNGRLSKKNQKAGSKENDNTFWTFVGYYGLSKLCVVWNTALLARQVEGRRFAASTASVSATGQDAEPSPGGEHKIFVASTHPGIITTHLYRDLFPTWFLDKVLYYPSLLIGKSIAESAQSTLKACVEVEGLVQGGYYLDGGEYGPNSSVNCLSSHAMNTSEVSKYGKWLDGKLNQLSEKSS